MTVTKAGVPTPDVLEHLAEQQRRLDEARRLLTEHEEALDRQRRLLTETGGRSYQPQIEHPPTTWELDARGYKRSPQTMPDFRLGETSKSKGKRFPRNPPTIAESIRFVRACPDTVYGRRRAALYIVLWRTGIRINEALSLLPSDLDEVAGSITVRYGKATNGSGPRLRVVGMDAWGWQQVRPWISERGEYPPGPLFPVLDGPTAGIRAWGYSCVNSEFKRTAKAAGIDKRIAPHQLRHAFATERWREGVDIGVIQKQLGHSSRHITYRYISEMSTEEVLDEARHRALPSVAVNEVMELLMPAVSL